MASRYDPIWNEIKANGTATITVSKDAARTVTEGVIEAKKHENTARIKVGLIGWSRMKIERTPISDTHIKITFSFLYSTDI